MAGHPGRAIERGGATELDQVQATSDPGQPSLKKVVRPQKNKTGMRHKAGMGSKLNLASPEVESSVSLALGFSLIPAPSKSDSGFLQKQHAARELDSGQLPSGRMRNPNRYR
ncbi:hypothetical protein F2Q70_00011997 [Brassica cretica]|uniref:Uncharacterized protein n=1 Tax=Brassica cretica TaxID=69181 RepID=A0A8S9M0Q3_BRACR|nr:hypothetical protein F2Q70_00011997 [Brassica cretica]